MGMMILAATLDQLDAGGRALPQRPRDQATSWPSTQASPIAEMKWKSAGINHLAWFTELTHEGRDLYPILFEKARDPNSEFYRGDPIRCDMMLHFGAFITESSGHLSEYLPYYRKRKDLLEKYARSGYRGESGFYANNWPKWREASATRAQAGRSPGSIEIKTTRSWEYASWIIEAHQTDRPFVIHGNVINHGLIDNLPQGQCVEVPVMIDRNGFNPVPFRLLAAADGCGLPRATCP